MLSAVPGLSCRARSASTKVSIIPLVKSGRLRIIVKPFHMYIISWNGKNAEPRYFQATSIFNRYCHLLLRYGLKSYQHRHREPCWAAGFIAPGFADSKLLSRGGLSCYFLLKCWHLSEGERTEKKHSQWNHLESYLWAVCPDLVIVNSY